MAEGRQGLVKVVEQNRGRNQLTAFEGSEDVLQRLAHMFDLREVDGSGRPFETVRRAKDRVEDGGLLLLQRSLLQLDET